MKRFRYMAQWVKIRDDGREASEVSSMEIDSFVGFINISPHRVYLYCQMLSYLPENRSYGEIWIKIGREYKLEPIELFKEE